MRKPKIGRDFKQYAKLAKTVKTVEEKKLKTLVNDTIQFYPNKQNRNRYRQNNH